MCDDWVISLFSVRLSIKVRTLFFVSLRFLFLLQRRNNKIFNFKFNIKFRQQQLEYVSQLEPPNYRNYLISPAQNKKKPLHIPNWLSWVHWGQYQGNRKQWFCWKIKDFCFKRTPNLIHKLGYELTFNYWIKLNILIIQKAEFQYCTDQ